MLLVICETFHPEIMVANSIQKELKALGDARAASFLQRFFKTGKGEYGEGDLFRGIRIPVLRKLAAAHQGIPLSEAEQLLRSAFHEDRMLALLILLRRYAKGDEAAREKIYKLYLKNTKFINNWDLVDVSAPHIVGRHLHGREKAPLYRLARSRSLWGRRIGMMSTFYFIRRGEFDDAIRIAEMLLKDKEDLIHKAVGWMLREIGKRSINAESDFLIAHHKQMPRTMLRYAIEKFPPDERGRYLRGEV